MNDNNNNNILISIHQEVHSQNDIRIFHHSSFSSPPPHDQEDNKKTTHTTTATYPPPPSSPTLVILSPRVVRHPTFSKLLSFSRSSHKTLSSTHNHHRLNDPDSISRPFSPDLPSISTLPPQREISRKVEPSHSSHKSSSHREQDENEPVSNHLPPPSTGSELFVSINIHIIFLFIFLTVFFVLFVSKLATNMFDKEIRIVLGERNLLKTLITTDKDRSIQRLLVELESHTGILTSLESSYSSPSKDVQEHNKWMFILTYTILVSLSSIVCILIVILRCVRPTIPIIGICIESLIIFGIVGIVEYLFFTTIAFQYNPAPPSLMVKTVIDSIQEWLLR